MKEITIEGTLNKEHCQIFDSNLYQVLLKNHHELTSKVTQLKSTNRCWDMHVSHYISSLDSIYGKLPFREYGEVESNVLIDNCPVEASLLDFIVVLYTQVKTNLSSMNQKIQLFLRKSFHYSDSVIKKILDDIRLALGTNEINLEIEFTD